MERVLVVSYPTGSRAGTGRGCWGVGVGGGEGEGMEIRKDVALYCCAVLQFGAPLRILIRGTDKNKKEKKKDPKHKKVQANAYLLILARTHSMQIFGEFPFMKPRNDS